MKLVPRYYQTECVDAIFDYFNDGKEGNPIAALPTGTGKSLVQAMFIERVLRAWPSQRILALTHVKELIENNFATLLKLWPQAPAGIYSAGLGRRDVGKAYKVTFAGIASVAKKPELFGHIDLVLVDECHLVSPKETTGYRKFLAALMEANPDLRVIGLSATPYRLGQGLITDDGLFTDVCYDATSLDSFLRLMAEGYLAKLVTKRTSERFDVSNVGIASTGDYNSAELLAAVDTDEVTKAACREIVNAAAGRSCWLIFASGVEHAEHVCAALCALGVKAATVHSKISDEERDRYVRDLKSGKLTAIVNNNVLTTGFDCPRIDLIAMLRPTVSTGLWVQMLGRGTRPSPGKENCLVLDFAGNTERLGPINDPVLPKKKGARKGGLAPVKACPVCSAYVHASVRICPECQAEFPESEVKIDPYSGGRDILAGELPQVETFAVDSMQYDRHVSRKGLPDMVRVSYVCGLRVFNQWLCFSHPVAYARHKAREWWRTLSTESWDAPENTDEALSRMAEIQCPAEIQVWVNKRTPEVMQVGATQKAAPESVDSPF